MRRTTCYSIARLLAITGTVCTCVSAATITFDFDGDLGNSTPFTDTVSGLSATFSSSGDPGGFGVIPTFLAPPMVGGILLDPGPAGLNDVNLTIQFSALQSMISLDFATNSGLGVPAEPERVQWRIFSGQHLRHRNRSRRFLLPTGRALFQWRPLRPCRAQFVSVGFCN